MYNWLTFATVISAVLENRKLKSSGPIQVKLTYSSIIAIVILLNTKHKKNATLTLKVVNKTVTNKLHGTNFQASNSRNRLL